MRPLLRSVGIVMLFVFIGSLCWAEQDHRPTLKETLEWMHSAFPNSRIDSDITDNITRELNYIDGKHGDPPSCTITIAEHLDGQGRMPITIDTIIDLSLIDPNSIQQTCGRYCNQQTSGGIFLSMTATNDKEIIIRKGEFKDAKPEYENQIYLAFIDEEYPKQHSKMP